MVPLNRCSVGTLCASLRSRKWPFPVQLVCLLSMGRVKCVSRVGLTRLLLLSPVIVIVGALSVVWQLAMIVLLMFRPCVRLRIWISGLW